MMSFKEKVALLAMILSQVVGPVNGIRSLKEGPKSRPDSRIYKSGLDFRNTLEHQQTSPVQVQCTENTMVVIIRADLYRSGRRLDARQLRLGRGGSAENCGANRLNDAEFVIEASLHECGSELWVEGDSLIYANTLFYTPTPNPFGIIRSSGTAVRVQCHYKRFEGLFRTNILTRIFVIYKISPYRTHFVSSHNQATPTLRSPPSTRTPPHFSFQLMDDDWKSKRPSSVYHMGDIINIQASVVGSDHVPVKLYLDSCVATLERDLRSKPQYPLIENHGCPAEHSSAPSSVYFLPRTEDQVLQMEVDILPFCKNEESSAKHIYITCFLKVSDAALAENSENKACTYSGNGWKSIDGQHDVCECCESSCDLNQGQFSKWNQSTDNSITSDKLRSAVVTVGPVIIVD